MKAVREGDGVTLADEGVQRLIRRRIEGYPDKADSERHRARFVSFDALLIFSAKIGTPLSANR